MSTTSSSMVIAIAQHLDAHERYRLLSAFTNASPRGVERWQAADEASTAADEARDKAFRALGTVMPESVADIGALAIHLRMILQTAKHYEDEFAPAGECFDILQSACAAFAGRPG